MTATLTDQTGKLNALAVTLEQFGGRKAVGPASLPVRAAVALKMLRATGRDFLDETPAMKAAIVAAIKGALRGGKINAAEWARVAAEAVQAHVVGRFEAQGGDVALAPLSDTYRGWKARKGLDPRIGVAHTSTGLLSALKSARWVTRNAA